MSEVNLCLQNRGDGFVPTELFAVVHSQAAYLPDKRPQFHDDRRSHFIGLALRRIVPGSRPRHSAIRACLYPSLRIRPIVYRSS